MSIRTDHPGGDDSGVPRASSQKAVGEIEDNRASRDSLPAEGFVRLNRIIAPIGPIPVSRSTWWAGVKEGRFPQPLKLGPKTTVWRVEDMRALIRNGLQPARLAR